MTATTAVGLGWRVHSWWAVVVAVRGPATSPVIIHRERVTLIDDPSVQEPYHAAVGRSEDEAWAVIRSAEGTATSSVSSIVRSLASSLGPVSAMGVVGGDRRVSTDLSKILGSHARLHSSERDLYERAVVAGAKDAGLPVSTIPATGRLLDEASQMLGVDLGVTLGALGASIGRPWQKDHKEATAAALVALNDLT